MHEPCRVAQSLPTPRTIMLKTARCRACCDRRAHQRRRHGAPYSCQVAARTAQEKVGVGQSEMRVAEMTDFLLVLMLAGAGDELQGIKRGLLELADLIAIAKADGGNVIPAKLAASKYAYAMHLLADPEQGMAPVITCSALDGTGLEEIWKIISERTAERERSGYLHTRRNEQNINWMWSLVDQQIHDMLHQRPAVDSVARSAAAQVRVGVLSPIMAAETIPLRPKAGDDEVRPQAGALPLPLPPLRAQPAGGTRQ